MLGLAVVTSPGKHVEEHVNAFKAPTAFDARLPTAFLFMFCPIIGPQFVSKAFNCPSLQCVTKATSCFPHRLCHLLLPDF